MEDSPPVSQVNCGDFPKERKSPGAQKQQPLVLQASCLLSTQRKRRKRGRIRSRSRKPELLSKEVRCDGERCVENRSRKRRWVEGNIMNVGKELVRGKLTSRVLVRKKVKETRGVKNPY
jgi:hypothetical protein